jgi:hypothetical protein
VNFAAYFVKRETQVGVDVAYAEPDGYKQVSSCILDWRDSWNRKFKSSLSKLQYVLEISSILNT